MARKKSSEASGKKEEKLEWKSKTLEEYREWIPQFVHFSSKSINSNTDTGIRIDAKQGLPGLPYVSARALIGKGKELPLDYCKGGAVVAGVCANVAKILRDDPNASLAGEEEKNFVRSEIGKIADEAYESSSEYIDHRLRQVLLPKEDQEDGYLAITPITSSGLCGLLLDSGDGIVIRHNNEVWEARKTNGNGKLEKRLIKRAFLGIGGSNPQNVGCFARAMQRPVFLTAPRANVNQRQAFSLYYKGISIDFVKNPKLNRLLQKYIDFRKKRKLDIEANSLQFNPGRTNLDARQEEVRIVDMIAKTVLDLAEEARQCLLECQDVLPFDYNQDGSRALCSPSVKEEIRALLDAGQRENQWPRKMARLTGFAMENAKLTKDQYRLVLDQSGSASLLSLLEDAFR